MPGKVQPRSALATRAKQSSRREQTGKRERVRDCHCSAEQVTAGQHQQRTGFQETELTEEQDARDEVIEDKRRLIDWKKGSDRRQRNFRERRGKEKNGDRYRDDRERQTTLGPLGRERRQKIRNSSVAAKVTAFPKAHSNAPDALESGAVPCGSTGSIQYDEPSTCSRCAAPSGISVALRRMACSLVELMSQNGSHAIVGPISQATPLRVRDGDA